MTHDDIGVRGAADYVEATNTQADVVHYKKIMMASIQAADKCDNSAAWILAIDELRTEFVKKLFNIQDAEVISEPTS